MGLPCGKVVRRDGMLGLVLVLAMGVALRLRGLAPLPPAQPIHPAESV